MCQQWFSVAGLTLEVIGFLLIAWEWRHVFEHSVALRDAAVEEDYELMVEGEEAAKERRIAQASMWRNTQRENPKDNRRRATLFYWGVVLVVLGFLGQLVGSWPYGMSVLGFKSCS